MNHPCATMTEVHARLIDFQNLKTGWDSYKGVPVAGRAAAKAEEILERLLPTLGEVSVVPCSDGSVQLEWHAGGFDIEIWVNAT